MDPNEALSEIRRILQAYASEGEEFVDCDRFFDLVQGLDEWISKGGFLPEAWQPISLPAADPVQSGKPTQCPRCSSFNTGRTAEPSTRECYDCGDAYQLPGKATP